MNREIADKIYPAELPFLLEHYPKKISILSLDCFDTLVWRISAKPEDVFFLTQHQPAFQSVGLTAQLRVQSETRARQLRWLKKRTREVFLDDIYREHSPELTAEQLVALSQAELTIEQTVCYAFAPVVDLIRSAYRKGIKIIIVSDTYLREKQLRSLLEHVLPSDVMGMIACVFCSSEHAYGKMNGLFHVMLRTCNERPENILHLGDNLAADYISARAAKLNALHFIQENDYLKNLQRLTGLTANLMNPATRTLYPLNNIFRPIFAIAKTKLDKPEFLLGYYVLGPIMYGFAHFILTELQKMRAAGKTPKLLFLLRDGYLPAQACEVLAGEKIGHSVMISRFAAYAASFRTEEDVDRYLLEMLQPQRFKSMTRQLLLPEDIAASIIRAAKQSVNPVEEFVRLIHKKDVLRMIFKKSADFRARLKKYLEKQTELQAGDSIVLVDLGYSGTVQRQLAVFFQEMNVQVEGRYLIASEAPQRNGMRVGLIDTTHVDNKTINALLHFIALFEKLCTSNDKSSVDYTEDGEVIYADTIIDEQQHAKLAAIQHESMQFVQDARRFFQAMPEKFSEQIRREMVLTELARLIYMPTAPELHYLQSFQFDYNLGMQDVRHLFDPKKGLEGLKRRGLFYIDNNTHANRTNYPAELRIAGFELALTFMSQIRFGLDPNVHDMLPRQEAIAARLSQPQQELSLMVGARATHDGYYAIEIEAGKQIVLFVGAKYQWLQINSAEFIQKDAFIQQKEAGNTINAKDRLVFHEMLDYGGGLLQCLSRQSCIVIAGNGQERDIFRLVYRPVVFQESQAVKVS